MRGRFQVAGQPTSEAALFAGQRIVLAPEVVLDVLEVDLPAFILGVRSPHLPTTHLVSVCSLVRPTDAKLVPGFREDGVAQFWNRGADWRVQVGHDVIPLDGSSTVDVHGVVLSAVLTPIAGAEANETSLDRHTRPSLRVLAHHDTVTLERSDGHLLHVGGISAKILSELVELDGPANWETLATELWGRDEDRGQLRRRWDVAVVRLRRKLRDHGIPPNIISADGTGNFELVLSSADEVQHRG